jgi:hypothetical protein
MRAPPPPLSFGQPPRRGHFRCHPAQHHLMHELASGRGQLVRQELAQKDAEGGGILVGDVNQEEDPPSFTKASNMAARTSAAILLRVPARRPPVLRPLAKGHLSKFVYFRSCLHGADPRTGSGGLHVQVLCGFLGARATDRAASRRPSCQQVQQQVQRQDDDLHAPILHLDSSGRQDAGQDSGPAFERLGLAAWCACSCRCRQDAECRDRPSQAGAARYSTRPRPRSPKSRGHGCCSDRHKLRERWQPSPYCRSRSFHKVLNSALRPQRRRA